MLVGRAIAQAVSRWPLASAARVRTRVNPVGFVVDRVALGQVFLRVLRFSLVNIIPTWAPHSENFKEIHSFIHSPLHSSSSGAGLKARKSGRSPVRRQSHPHNQNIRILVSCSSKVQKQKIRHISLVFKLPKNNYWNLFLYVNSSQNFYVLVISKGPQCVKYRSIYLRTHLAQAVGYFVSFCFWFPPRIQA
jgi:hypothetical protein